MLVQEKGEKHVFRKSRKYRTLCSVAIGTLMTAVVGLGGQPVYADEVVGTGNPATNLIQAKPDDIAEHVSQANQSDQASGDLPIAVPHEELDKAVQVAKGEGVQVVTDKDANLGTTKTAEETATALSKAQADSDKQVAEVKKVTADYVKEKATHARVVKEIETANQELKAAQVKAAETASQVNQEVEQAKTRVKHQYSDARIEESTREVSSGDGRSKTDFENYTKQVQMIGIENQKSLATYLDKKSRAEVIKTQNQALQRENEAGLARMKEENEAIKRRNQAGQSKVDEANRQGQAAVDKRNAEKQKLVTNRDAEIATVKERNRKKQEEVARQNQSIDAENQADLARYNRELAEITRGEDGYISEALAQALNLNDGEPQARHGASTRNPDSIISRGDALLGGYSRILDSTGFFVYDHFATGETLQFDYQNLLHASFAGKKITHIQYALTNIHSPLGKNAVKLVVPNDPTEGFSAYREDGTGNWREDKMEFRLVAKYFLEDGSQVTFSRTNPGVFTHSSLNHNDIGLEYVKDSSGRFVPIHGSSIQVTNEGLARSLSANRASDLHLPEEWDTTSSRYAYKGAIVSSVTSGNSYTVTFGQGDMPTNAGNFTYWFALNTLPVARTVRPHNPKPHVKAELEPVPDSLHVTPEVFKPQIFKPEKPVTFTPKKLKKVEEPSLRLVKVTSSQKPVLKLEPKPLLAPTVHVHHHTLTMRPGIRKEVENTEHVALNAHQVAKDSVIIYPLKVASLPQNRPETKNVVFDDYLPAGYLFDVEQTKAENDSYDLLFNPAKNFVRLTAKDNLLTDINRDKSKTFTLPTPKLFGRVQNDGASYTNAYTLTINKNQAHPYVVTSNKVVVHTPGDGGRTSRIQPSKTNRNQDGVVIDGKTIPFGTVHHYTLKWDLDQYKNDKSSQVSIDKGFFFVEDYPEEVLDVLKESWFVTTETGQKVSDLEVKSFSSLASAPKEVRAKLANAGIAPKGAFLLYLPKDNQDFYRNYVQQGISLLIHQDMKIKDSLYGKEVTYSNKAYQVDFGNGYETKKVTNRIIPPQPIKQNLNRKGQDINNTPRLIGSENVYRLTWDLDQYKGIEATKDQIATGFYFVEDYPEEALNLELKDIQIVTQDGKAVEGIEVHHYASLKEAPEKLQEALANRKIVPKGAFQVFEPKDRMSFYKNYVQTGQTLTILEPMRAKDELYNSGKDYQNQAYQIDFGLAYATEVVKNHVPKVNPHKENQDEKGLIINGKAVLPNTVNHYKIDLDYSAYKNLKVSKETLSKGFYLVDDYPEDALDVDVANIKVVDETGQVVQGLSLQTYKTVEELPESLQAALLKRHFIPKGAILVLSADKPEVFFNSYVKTGKHLTTVLPMTLKKEFVQKSGQYENTAYQVDFGIAYVTETVVNSTPKLESHKDVVIDLNHRGESLDGKEIGLNQSFSYRLEGALIPKQRAKALADYSFVDDYDETHDAYSGRYQVFSLTDVTLMDKTTLKAGTDLSKYTLQTVDTKTGKVTIIFNRDFLSSISDDSSFQAEVYLAMKRIAAGQVENTMVHTVNGFEIRSNTVKTKTPEPPKPVELSKPTQPRQENKRELPHTGEQSSVLGVVAGLSLLGLAAGLKKKGSDK